MEKNVHHTFLCFKANPTQHYIAYLIMNPREKAKNSKLMYFISYTKQSIFLLIVSILVDYTPQSRFDKNKKYCLFYFWGQHNLQSNILPDQIYRTKTGHSFLYLSTVCYPFYTQKNQFNNDLIHESIKL